MSHKIGTWVSLAILASVLLPPTIFAQTPTLADNNAFTGNNTFLNIDNIIYMDGNVYLLSANVASGSATLGTAAIASNIFASVVTTTATGTLTTDAISWSFNADPNSVTGYGAGTTGTPSKWLFPNSGNVNFRVRNLTSRSITLGAATLNWCVVP